MGAEGAVGCVFETVVDLDIDQIAARVQGALEAGAAPLDVLDAGLSTGVWVVGERYRGPGGRCSGGANRGGSAAAPGGRDGAFCAADADDGAAPDRD